MTATRLGRGGEAVKEDLPKRHVVERGKPALTHWRRGSPPNTDMPASSKSPTRPVSDSEIPLSSAGDTEPRTRTLRAG